jgi:hypothetical protein
LSTRIRFDYKILIYSLETDLKLKSGYKRRYVLYHRMVARNVEFQEARTIDKKNTQKKKNSFDRAVSIYRRPMSNLIKFDQ